MKQSIAFKYLNGAQGSLMRYLPMYHHNASCPYMLRKLWQRNTGHSLGRLDYAKVTL